MTCRRSFFFFFNDTATTEIYTLSLHDALPIFGEVRSYAAGERIFRAGSLAPGLVVIISGKVEITQDACVERRETVVTHGPSNFVGELAQLSDRPSLVNAEAIEPVAAFVISSHRLRDLMV